MHSSAQRDDRRNAGRAALLGRDAAYRWPNDASDQQFPTGTGNSTTTTIDTVAFAVQITDRDTGVIIGEANDLDTIDEALDNVRRFYT